MVAARMAEDVLQLRVEEGLRFYRWEFYHDHTPRRNRAGLPDIVAARSGRPLFLELKVQDSRRGRLSPKQVAWRDQLGAFWHLVRPLDLLDGTLDLLLR